LERLSVLHSHARRAKNNALHPTAAGEVLGGGRGERER
jgi:hypothetical protein